MSETIASNSTQTSHESDLLLARGTLDGDENAIRGFVNRMQCIPAILAAQNQRMGSPLSNDDLGDVVQDSVTKVWLKLGSYAGRASLETWAYRFCFLELMNSIRKRRRWQQSAPIESELESLVSPETDAAIQFEFLHRGLEAVGPPESDVLRLKHFEELTFAEIAKRLGISPNTAKTQYYRGLSKLRECVEQSMGNANEGAIQ